jgi:uncharacterized protein involved in exopolysaccharide biosynthesis
MSVEEQTPDREGDVSLLELTTMLLKRWKLVVGLPLGLAVLAAVIVLILPVRYRAHTVFVPEVQSSGVALPSGLAGLASQFGMPVTGGPNSPRFYADVVASRTLRDQVLLSRLPDPRTAAPDDSAALLDIFGIEGADPAERLERGRKALESVVEVEYNDETTVVNLSAQTLYPALSADLANHYLQLLNRFNLETRQSTAQKQRQFIEVRVTEAEAELRSAEADLQKFLESNRLFRDSPHLNFEYERLQRQVAIKQEVLITLRRSYEDARIQEVNDTPVLTVIDRAVAPREKSWPRRRLTVAVVFLLGGVIGGSIALTLEYFEGAERRQAEVYEELRGRWTAAKTEIKGALRTFGRRRSE